ncbi:hypothetical protein RMSM_05601 [Rhodopirellula maiorica SM1]|uniref:Uncharacterized protein n=1 Tax=Rhodopirellula maiorica SM1 TaxID=1265738 RepID=M5RDL4_9BACT|nr:hypothetical protein RMSM_05601 [Rhodopirellula maiorica SM1]
MAIRSSAVEMESKDTPFARPIIARPTQRNAICPDWIGGRIVRGSC